MTADTTAPATDDFWAVIPAGGAGTRLWPLSRAGAPKFLHDLTGSGRTLIQATVDRLLPLCVDRMLIVTGAAHAGAVAEQLPELPVASILAEPSPRDSMAAIGWAAAILERRDPTAVLGSFAADHVIGDVEAFRDCVREAVVVARTGKLVTIGIEPTFPSSGFGYIRLGDQLTIDGAPSAHQVIEFVEKPDTTTAQRYLAGGDYRWNAGMFVVQASALLDMLARYQPELAAGLRRLAAGEVELERIWPELTKIAIDHAVAEPAAADGLVAVVPGGFGWDDVGDFASLSSLLPSAPGDDAKVLGDPASVIMQEATGTVITGGRTVVLLGLHDVVVVDTPDALLVASRERAQDVKKVVELLKSTERGHLT
jgi:mannose-1-phosphate guanylyltransferase